MKSTELQRLTLTDSEAFWRRVNKLIKQHNTTQEQISSTIGTHFATFRNWSWTKTYPRMGEIYLLAQALETNINYLLFGVDTEPVIQTEYIIGKKILDIVNIVKKAVNQNGL
ncbi:MAG: hypothetical protein FWC06_06125 [Treponema sp.]|nr:hypothetical protein [Treponema sp.]